MTRSAFGLILEGVETLLLTLIVFLVIQSFVAQPYRVEQGSMMDTLQDGQMLLVDKLTPHFTAFARGDIIVFQPPASSDEGTTPFIKRVIGLPGDEVMLDAGRVVVNGIPLEETYTFEGQPTYPNSDTRKWIVPDGSLFVMGDHRWNSTDSRSSRLGPIPVDDVIGRAVFRYWPLSAFGPIDAPRYPPIPAVAVH